MSEEKRFQYCVQSQRIVLDQSEDKKWLLISVSGVFNGQFDIGTIQIDNSNVHALRDGIEDYISKLGDE